MEVFAKTFFCPDLVSQEDGIMIEQTLQNSPGIEEITVDHAGHTVYVSSANQSGLSDVEWILRNAGFPPEDRSAAEAASVSNP